MHRAWLIFILLWLIGPCLAQDLPLGRHYRPQRFLPARSLVGDQTLRLQGAGGLDAIWVADVPAISAADWRAVPESVRWVGVVDGTPSSPRAGDLVTRIELSQCLASPAAAWNALDEFIVSVPAAQQLGERWLATLAAAGTRIRLTGGRFENSSLPWQEGGTLLVPAAAAPASLLAPEAYLPLDSLQPIQPRVTRQRLLILACLLTASLIAASTLPRRYWPYTVAVCILAFGLLLLWGASLPAISTARGRICIEGPTSARDQWLYLIARRPTQVAVSLVTSSPSPAASDETLWVEGDLLLPVFESARQAGECEFTQGGSRCVVRLRAGDRLALRARTLLGISASSPAPVTPSPLPVTPSPLRAIAEFFYLGDDHYLKGQLLEPNQDWPTLIVAPRPRP